MPRRSFHRQAERRSRAVSSGARSRGVFIATAQVKWMLLWPPMGSSHASPLGRSAPPPEAPHHRRVSRWRTGSRREVLALNVLAASLTSLTPLLPALARTTPLLGDSADRPPAVVMPLYRCNGAFCTYYTVDDQRFRAGTPALALGLAPPSDVATVHVLPNSRVWCRRPRRARQRWQRHMHRWATVAAQHNPLRRTA